MRNLMNKICKARDIISGKDYNKIIFYHMKFKQLAEELSRQLAKKVEGGKNYELDFTAQDLTELAEDIKMLLKKWDYATDIKRNILRIKKQAEFNVSKDLQEFARIMDIESHNIQSLVSLKLVAEHLAIILYFMEECYEDEFAIKYTKRY